MEEFFDRISGMNRMAGRSEDSAHGTQTRYSYHILNITFILSNLLMSSPYFQVELLPLPAIPPRLSFYGAGNSAITNCKWYDNNKVQPSTGARQSGSRHYEADSVSRKEL